MMLCFCCTGPEDPLNLTASTTGFIAQLVLEGKQYLDWAKLIDDSMREQLSMAK